MVRAVFDREAALQELGRAELGHKARTKRLVHTAGLLAQEAAGRSLPDRLPHRADYEGALNLANTPAVTHQAILQPHYQATRQRMLACEGVVLNISDLTELDYSGLRIACLGPIGNGGGKGFECHNSLAVDPARGDFLGLTSQILHVRDSDTQVEAQRQARAAKAPTQGKKPAGKRKGKGGRRPDETAAQRHERDSRESRLWIKGSEALGDIPEGKLWVDVCDRASDTFEYLQFMAGRHRFYVIRSKHNRGLDAAEAAEAELEAECELEVEGEGEEPPRRLHDLLRSLPGVMSWEVELSANKGQPARQATVQMAWVPVRIKAPQQYQGPDKESLHVWAIRVWEPYPPEGVKEPLEWLLLSNVAVQTDEQARERVSWYEWRPAVEEFHKAQKTGMGIEGLQLQSREGLEPLIGLLSILAVTLVNLRQQARQPEAATQPAREVVDPLWVVVLSLWRYGEPRDLSLRQFVLDLAKLGGYMNRRRDAWPGWIVLWRGITKLLHMVQYERSRAKCSQQTPEL
jgi:hypothetical protein